jgi:hypothetical protein
MSLSTKPFDYTSPQTKSINFTGIVKHMGSIHIATQFKVIGVMFADVTRSSYTSTATNL